MNQQSSDKPDLREQLRLVDSSRTLAAIAQAASRTFSIPTTPFAELERRLQRDMQRHQELLRATMGPSLAVDQLKKALEPLERSTRQIRAMAAGVSQQIDRVMKSWASPMRSAFGLTPQISAIAEQYSRQMSQLSQLSLRQFVTQLDMSQTTYQTAMVSLARGMAANKINPEVSRFARALEHRFKKEPLISRQVDGAEQTVPSVADATAETMAAAWEDTGYRVDVKWWISILLTVLLFLAQWQISGVQLAHMDENIEEHLEQIRRDLAARLDEFASAAGADVVVLRTTKLWSLPTTKSPVLMRLTPSTRMIIIARRRKWTQLLIFSDDGLLGTVGWTFNKYLRPAPAESPKMR